MWWEQNPGSPLPKQQAERVRPAVPTMDKPIMDKTPNALVSSTNHDTAVLGKALILRGELSGNEDLLIEGQFEGSINLQDHCLTIGSDAQIQADIQASRAIILGSVKGNVTAREKIEIRKTAHVLGDLIAGGILIEDGASVKGSIEITRDNGHQGSPGPSTRPDATSGDEAS
jgi:cytoskeletal protein CcmA (bactofilin family)